jgi:hypothetical protein
MQLSAIQVDIGNDENKPYASTRKVLKVTLPKRVCVIALIDDSSVFMLLVWMHLYRAN